jgi:hypothetical protein
MAEKVKGKPIFQIISLLAACMFCISVACLYYSITLPSRWKEKVYENQAMLASYGYKLNYDWNLDTNKGVMTQPYATVFITPVKAGDFNNFVRVLVSFPVNITTVYFCYRINFFEIAYFWFIIPNTCTAIYVQIII